MHHQTAFLYNRDYPAPPWVYASKHVGQTSSSMSLNERPEYHETLKQSKKHIWRTLVQTLPALPDMAFDSP